MEVLISTQYGSGWGTLIGMEYARDKQLVDFRKQFTDKEWAELAAYANYFVKQFYQKGMSRDEFFELLQSHVDSKDNANTHEKELLKKVVRLLQIIYNIKEEFPYLGGLENIRVKKVPKSNIFTIVGYDGYESIRYLGDFEWIVAKD